MRMVPLVLFAALLLPASAMAQTGVAPPPRGGILAGGLTEPPGGYPVQRARTLASEFGFGHETGRIRHEARAAYDNGQITLSEAHALFRASRRIDGHIISASAGGFSPSETAALRRRIETLKGLLDERAAPGPAVGL